MLAATGNTEAFQVARKQKLKKPTVLFQISTRKMKQRATKSLRTQSSVDRLMTYGLFSFMLTIEINRTNTKCTGSLRLK